MATRVNTALQNNIAGTVGGGFNGGTLVIRTGSQPASANTAPSGTVLATITLPATPFGSASAGAVAKAGTWQTTASASGVPGWARITGPGGTPNILDISVGHDGSGADMEIAELASGSDQIIQGGTVTVSTFTVTMPAG